MATKYECDRCGKQFVHSGDIGQLTYPLINNYNSLYNINGGKKDLCINCIKELADFLKPLPKEAKSR